MALLPRGKVARPPSAKDEFRWVQEMARRIAAILLLEPALDDNYEQVKTDTYDWQRTPAPPGGRS